MQKVLSTNLWTQVSAIAKHAKSRKAAIAYATVDHLHMDRGDQLIVDASDLAIRSGETKAMLLKQLYRKGVELYSCPALHAKVALLGDVAVIGSANLSASSASRLIEAGLITDHPSTVACVQSLLSQLIERSKPLGSSELARLAKLPVSPRRGPATASGARSIPLAPLGNRTWLVGVKELPEDAHPNEQAAREASEREAKIRQRSPRSDLSWIRWASNSRFAKECREGDLVFQVWTPLGYTNKSAEACYRDLSLCRIHLHALSSRTVARWLGREDTAAAI